MPYCTTCKFKLDYVVSNKKAPNDYRISVYTCKKCSKDNNNTTIITITRKKVPEQKLWDIINTDIFETVKI